MKLVSDIRRNLAFVWSLNGTTCAEPALFIGRPRCVLIALVAQTTTQPLTLVWATRLFDGMAGPVETTKLVPHFFTHTQSEEQIETDSVARLLGAPPNGAFLFGVSMKTNDFLQNEATCCRANAEMATRKKDREFWLNLAHRWEELSRARDENGFNIKAPRMYRSGRTIFTRRARMSSD